MAGQMRPTELLAALPRNGVGARVRLYPEPTHEGPHPDDQFATSPEGTVTRVETHINNPAWIVEVDVELDDGEKLTLVAWQFQGPGQRPIGAIAEVVRP